LLIKFKDLFVKITEYSWNSPWSDLGTAGYCNFIPSGALSSGLGLEEMHLDELSEADVGAGCAGAGRVGADAVGKDE